MMKWCIVALLILLSSVAMAQQEFPFIHRDLSALSGKKVWGTFVDSKNTLWIGTDIGLYKYDGNSVTHFNINDGLEDNEVLDFWGEEHGRLWIYSFTNRLCFIDLNTDKIYNSAQIPALKTRSDYTIKKVNIYGNEMFVLNERWLITKINVKNQTIASLPRFPIPQCLFYDTPGKRTMLLGGDGIYELLKNKWVMRCNVPVGIKYYDRFLYILQKDTLFRYDHNQLRKYKILPPFNDDGVDNKVYVFADDLIFVVKKHSFLVLMGNTWNAYNYTGLSDISKDKEGNLWIATRNDGLLFVPFFHSKVTRAKADTNESFSSLQVSGEQVILNSDKGNKYTYNNGLELLHKANISAGKQVYQIRHGAHLHWLFYKNHLSDFHNLGISGRDDRQTSLFDTVIHATIKEIKADGDTMYIRAVRSLYKMYFDGHQLHIINVLQKVRCMSLYAAPDGNLWYATLSRLYYYKNNRSMPIVLPNNYAVKIINAVGPYILLSNGDNKLYCYDTARHLYLQQKISDDPNIYLEQIFDIDKSHKFLKTNENLYLLEYNGGLSYNLIPIENLELDMHDIVEIRCRDSSVYILTTKTCYRYPFHMFTLRKSPPTPEITRLEYKTKDERNHIVCPAPAAIDAVSLPSGISSFSLYVSTHTITNKNTQIQYAISNKEEQTHHWLYLQTSNINISLPRYGKTYVYLRASSASSGFGVVRKSVVDVAYPLWYDYRVILSGIVLLLGTFVYIVILIFRSSIRRKERKQLQEIQALHNEFKAMNAMMNPHFVFNSLNSIQSFINDGNKKAANQYLLIFSKLIRQNMTNINTSHIPLRWELDVVKNYLEIEKLRFSEQLDYEIVVDEEKTLLCNVPPLLIQPLVENAIIHGLLPVNQNSGKLSITIRHIDEAIEITVSDNGIGYYNATGKLHDKASLGIDYIRKRLDKIAAITGTICQFEIEALHGHPGTKITLVLTDDL